MPRRRVLRLLILAALAVAVQRPGVPAWAQSPPVFHGVLSIRPAFGGIDKDIGIGSLTVKNWDFVLTPDSNGIAPDREPIVVAIGESERLVVPAGALRASRKGRRFAFRDPEITRGVRKIEIRQLKNDGVGAGRYRIRFSLVGIDLSRLVIEFPFCSPLAIIVGDDDGFSGVELDRPGGFGGSRVKVLGSCTDVADWPWV